VTVQPAVTACATVPAVALRRRIVPTMAALGLLTACATAVTAPPPASVERPALAVGDTWVVVKRVPPLRTVQTLVDVRGTTLVFRQTAPGGQSSAATYTPDRALFQGGVDDVEEGPHRPGHHPGCRSG